MRVIGGTARGRLLRGPPRERSGRPATRPTSDLVRGVIFDMLDALGADDARVLDLYAGSGALGIEALSRGEGTAVFVESRRDLAAVIERNLEVTRFVPRARVLQMPVSRALPLLEREATERASPWTLVLADPPYYDEAAPAAVASVASSSIVGPATVLVYEHQRRQPVAGTLGRMALYRSRRHGDTVVSIYYGEEFA